MPVESPPTPPSTEPPRVMLLSVWAEASQPWHARIVMPDARTQDFSSPFELARYLGQMAYTGHAPPRGGLR